MAASMGKSAQKRGILFVRGIVYDRHKDERSYITVIRDGEIFELPSRVSIYSSVNFRRRLRDTHRAEPAELKIVGKSGAVGLEGQYGWGGAWIRAHVKPGCQNYEIWVATRYTIAYLVIADAELVEVNTPKWAGSYAGVKQISSLHGASAVGVERLEREKNRKTLRIPA